MGFTEKNKNFINNKLIFEMKGLSEIEKIANYQLIKEETRTRLKASYLTSPDKVKFYLEAFETLYLFETDYLILNLFYEKELDNLFVYLNTYKCFKKLNFLYENHLPYKFWEFKRLNEYSKIEEFLKAEFLTIENIVERVWNNESSINNEFTRLYIEWLISQIITKSDNNYITYTLQLLTKKFNNSLTFDNIKPIVFLKEINKKLNQIIQQNIDIDLNPLIKSMENQFTDLLNKENLFVPLIDSRKSEEYTEQYLSLRNEFSIIIAIFKQQNTAYETMKYSDLFTLLNETKKDLNSKITTGINKRLINLLLPSNQEINIIERLQCEKHTELTRKEFYRKLYLYDYLDFK